MEIERIAAIICALGAIGSLSKSIWPVRKGLIEAIKRMWGHLRRDYLTIFGIGLAVAAIMLALWPTPPPPRIKIMHPDSGSEVPRETIVKGVSSDIPAGSNIWVCVVGVEEARRYYPQYQALDVGEMGEWELKLWFGKPEESGKFFHIVAMLASEEASAHFQEFVETCKKDDHWPGVEQDELPSGAKELHRITVLRR